MAKKVVAKGSQIKGNDVKLVPQKGQKHDDDDDEDFDGSDDGYDGDELNQNEDEDDDGEDDDSDDGEEEDDDEDSNEEEEEDDDDDDDEFEVQSGESSNSDSDEGDDEEDSDAEEDEEDLHDENAAEQKAITRKAEASIRHFREANVIKNVIKATRTGASKNKSSATDNNSNNTLVATTATPTTDLTSLLNTDDVSSDEEDRVDQDHINTIGRVPLHWYDAYDHIGYTINGQKLFKKGIAAGNMTGTDDSGSSEPRDRIDQAIENRDNPNSLNTVYDMYNDREVVLSARDLEIISRLQAGTYAHPEHNDMPDYVDYFSSIKEIMPLSARPLAKQSFLPSKWELLKVKKILKGIKNGTYKTIAQREEEKRNANSGLNGTKPPFYMLWKDEDDEDGNDEHSVANKRNLYHLPAPKMPLPGHAESYNPPPEYLLTAQEQEVLEQTDASDRQYNFIPKQFNSLRHVSGYKNFILERFERCLDLYLCPRKLKLRLNIDPESLVPRLPKPRELKPFPNTLCLQYLGHTKAVKCISVSADGQYLVSGSDDCTVRLWEVDTCLCRHIWTFPTPVNQVQWNPSVSHHVIAVATAKSVVFINTGTGDRDSTELSDSLFDTIRNNTSSNSNNNEDEEEDDVNDSDSDDEDNSSSKNAKKSKKVQAVWKVLSAPSSSTITTDNNNNNNNNNKTTQQYKYGYPIGPAAELSFPHTVLSVQWHYKGDYLASVQAAQAGATAVCIHQLSKGNTQRPFSKSPGIVQAVKFHPSRPFLFVVTQQHVKIYHLVEQKLMKKLMSGCKWLSSIDVHPSGDHIVLGSYDRRMLWFDLDLSSTPYKTLKYHEKAVRHVAIHRRYPLMVSASDDGSVHVFHSTVYSDLSRSPLIVPLKVLKGHGVIGGVGVLCTAFHPRQPWLFTSGADSVINLFQDI